MFQPQDLSNLIIEIIENYENYRVLYNNGKREPLNELRDKAEKIFKNLFQSLVIRWISVDINKGQYNNPPTIENLNIAFLEKHHKISKGIYCGIDFNQKRKSFNVYISTSINNQPNRQEWEKILLDEFYELKKYLNWEIPFSDSNHNWRYFAKTFYIDEFNDEVLEDLVNTIKTSALYVHKILNENINLVKEYLNKDDIPKYNIQNTLNKINAMKDLCTNTKENTIILSDEDLDSSYEQEESIIFELEGSQKEITSKVYERIPKLRKACIEHFKTENGIKCEICGFNFKEHYEEAGNDIIEVHHIVPLNEIKKPRTINPITDLLPVCSNCH